MEQGAVHSRANMQNVHAQPHVNAPPLQQLAPPSLAAPSASLPPPALKPPHRGSLADVQAGRDRYAGASSQHVLGQQGTEQSQGLGQRVQDAHLATQQLLQRMQQLRRENAQSVARSLIDARNPHAGAPGVAHGVADVAMAAHGAQPRRWLPPSLAGSSDAAAASASAASAAANGNDKASEDTKAALQAVADALEVSNATRVDPPPGSLNVDLLPHQKVALGWMLAREGVGRQGGAPCPDGGILADDQGLGKTITTIALLVSNKVEPAKPWRRATVDLKQEGSRKRRHSRLKSALDRQQSDRAPQGSGDGQLPSGAGEEATASLNAEAAEAAGAAAVASMPVATGHAATQVADARQHSASAAVAPANGADAIMVDSDEDAAAASAGPSNAAKRGDSSAEAASAPLQAGDTGDAHGAGPSSSAERAADAGPSQAQQRKGWNPRDLPLAGTLIVGPTSLLTQWESEINSKVSSKQHMNVLLYHGKKKDMITSATSLASYSVVITSYTMLANECGSTSNMKAGSETVDLASDDEETDGGSKGTKRKRRYGDDGLLFRVCWRRAVLDEAQSIKNYHAKMAQAASHLSAEHRWLLSGTPIQNSVQDLYSYFRFLRWAPFDRYRTFREQLVEPLKASPEKAYKRLQGVLAGVLLRRTKASMLDGKPILEMPKCEQTLKRIDFSPAEKKFYESVKSKSQEVMRELRTKDPSTLMHALAHLMRLREACCHTALVRTSPSNRSASAEELTAARRLPDATKLQLLESLAGPRARAECAVCSDLPEDPLVAPCGDVMCRACAATQLSNSEATGHMSCPICAAAIRAHELHCANALRSTLKMPLPAHLQVDAQPDGPEPQLAAAAAEVGESSKLKALNEVLDGILGPPQPRSAAAAAAPTSSGGAGGSAAAGASAQASKGAPGRRGCSSALLKGGAKKPLRALPAAPVATSSSSLHDIAAAGSAAAGSAGSPDKVIIFSQWTRLLDLVEASLKGAGRQFRRVDGSMSLSQREEQLTAFKARAGIGVLLLSTRAASLGLNLTVANHVVLLDLWWNPAVEEQAIDRTHRIGQKKGVHVTRIVVRDTVEDRILELQESKREIVKAAFGSGGGDQAGKLTARDLQFLFS